jgi:hypothetical protein
VDALPVVPAPVVEVPSLPPFAVEAAPLKTLQRYDSESPKLSLLARLTGKHLRIASKGLTPRE